MGVPRLIFWLVCEMKQLNFGHFDASIKNSL